MNYYKISNLEKEFIITHKIEDEIFGKINILQNKETEEIIMSKEFICNNLYDLENSINQINEKMKLKNKNLLNLLDYSCKLIDSNCFQIIGFYLFPSKNLYHILEERRDTNNFLKITEIQKILSDTLKGLEILEKNNIYHGILRPEFIGYYEDNNNFIISDKLNNFLKPELEQYKFIKNNLDIYITDNLFNNILNKNRKINHNPFKSEIYSLGLIILELSILKSIQNIYSFENKQINNNQLNNYLNLLPEIYGDEGSTLKDILNLMLEENEDERLNSEQLLNLLDIENVENNTVNFTSQVFTNLKESNLKLDKSFSKINCKIIFRTMDGKIYNEEEYKNLKNNNDKEKKSLLNYDNFKKIHTKIIKNGKEEDQVIYRKIN